LRSELLEQLIDEPDDAVRTLLTDLGEQEQREIAASLFDWEGEFARPEQCEPEGPWFIWALNAGRGFGKTRTGAEWIRKEALRAPGRRGGIIARTAADIRDVMIEGPSGILACCAPWEMPKYEPSNRRLIFPNGSKVLCRSAEKPDSIRGPEFEFAWADELASWVRLRASWDNLMYTLRAGPKPRLCITTTPRPLRFLKELYARDHTVVTGGSTYDNQRNLAPSFFDEVIEKNAGTTKGQQEIFAKILDEADGALWGRKLFDDHRLGAGEVTPDLDRIVVAVDPNTTTGEDADEVGIVAAGRSWHRNARGKLTSHFYVLQDESGDMGPLQWSHKVLDVFDAQSADRIVGEVNNGGELVEITLRTVREEFPYKAVNASRGKAIRAEPIVGLYEQGRVHHVGYFTDLEDQCCNFVPGQSDYSPGRLDALVWAITELMGSKLDEVQSVSGIGKADRSSPWGAM